jgi:hypothetical protein
MSKPGLRPKEYWMTSCVVDEDNVIVARFANHNDRDAFLKTIRKKNPVLHFSAWEGGMDEAERKY